MTSFLYCTGGGFSIFYQFCLSFPPVIIIKLHIKTGLYHTFMSQQFQDKLFMLVFLCFMQYIPFKLRHAEWREPRSMELL